MCLVHNIILYLSTNTEGKSIRARIRNIQPGFKKKNLILCKNIFKKNCTSISDGDLTLKSRPSLQIFSYTGKADLGRVSMKPSRLQGRREGRVNCRLRGA